MGVTLWTFLVLPDGTVNRYPYRRYDRWFERGCALGVAVGSEARFVQLAIETRRGHPLRALRAWFIRYELDTDGFVSVEQRQRSMRDAAAAITIGFDLPGEADVVSLEPFIARRRRQVDHSWTPDEIQLHAIGDAINDHAAKELVTTDGRTLVPL